MTIWEQAAVAIKQADALLIGAGAGMGVDSGLPDFRGNEGFWKAYPMLYGRPFVSMANPRWFTDDPEIAWGFYGHRRQLYRSVRPHNGFGILHKWAASMQAGYFVFTSNVDGHFQKSGFAHDRIVECHGSLDHLQCNRLCHEEIWQADNLVLDIDPHTLRAQGQLPQCPLCLGLARPNVLMFSDSDWLSERTDQQHQRMSRWLKSIHGLRLVTIELGAGTAIPSVRYFCEGNGQTLIRINVREAHVPPHGLGLAAPALSALQRLDAPVSDHSTGDESDKKVGTSSS